MDADASAGDAVPATTATASAPPPPPPPLRLPEAVVVHPLVLLSVVDHYHRVARDTRKRVLGCLLGEVSRGRVDVTNSFAGESRICFFCAGGPERENEWGERKKNDRADFFL
jgi:hypothetical protein